MLGEAGKLPEIYSDLEINYFLLRRLLGVKTEGDKKAGKVRRGPIFALSLASSLFLAHTHSLSLSLSLCLRLCRAVSLNI